MNSLFKTSIKTCLHRRAHWESQQRCNLPFRLLGSVSLRYSAGPSPAVHTGPRPISDAAKKAFKEWKHARFRPRGAAQVLKNEYLYKLRSLFLHKLAMSC